MNLDLDRSTWRRVTLGGVVKNVNVTVKDPADVGIDRVIAMEHLDPGDLKIHRWGDIASGTTFTRRVRPGQTLFGKRRAYQRKVAYVDFDAICSGDILTFEPDPAQMLSAFLPFIVQGDDFYDHALGTSAGSLSPRTNWRDLSSFEFDLPPLDEQERIADLLWAVDREERSLRDLLRHLRSVQEVLISKHFVTTGAGTLADLCARDGIRIGPFGAQLHASDYVPDGDCAVVMPQDMVQGRVSTKSIQRISRQRAEDLASHRVTAGDILLPRRGELDRRALVTDDQEGWLCGTGSVRVRVRDGVSTRAVFLALSSAATVQWLRANATGTTMPNLNTSIVSKIPVSVPSGRELERALREVDAAEGALAAATTRLQAAARLRSSLLADVFGVAA